MELSILGKRKSQKSVLRQPNRRATVCSGFSAIAKLRAACLGLNSAPVYTLPYPYIYETLSLLNSGIKGDVYVVRDLFNHEGSGWNNNLISSLFPPEVASKIVSIPFSSTSQSDCVRWTFCKDGAYSVKSGYWIAKRLKDASSSTSSSSAHDLDNWRWVWNLRLSLKICIFIWRCFRGILHSKTHLRKRGMHVDPICTCCGFGEETMEHIFRDCSWTSFFWRASPLRINSPKNVDRIPLHEWLAFYIHNKPVKFVEVFASLLWSVWKARNLREFQSKQLSHIDCFLMVNNMISEFQDANCNHRLTVAVPPLASGWIPPPEGRIKFNSDASITSAGDAGLGRAFRNHNANLIKSFAVFRPNCHDVELAEGLACLQGVHMARDEGFNDLIVESDNQSLIFTLQKCLIPRTVVGTVIGDILQLAKGFDKIEFHWIGRHHNRLAHHLASLAHNSEMNIDVNNPRIDSISHFVSVDALGLNV